MNTTNDNTFCFKNILKLHYGPVPLNSRYKNLKNKIPNLYSFSISLKDIYYQRISFVCMLEQNSYIFNIISDLKTLRNLFNFFAYAPKNVLSIRTNINTYCINQEDDSIIIKPQTIALINHDILRANIYNLIFSDCFNKPVNQLIHVDQLATKWVN